ncbi:MAG: hypothetical protein IPK33_33255 [Gemmatimonadetes bacterium]|nr:hypothetical protein [Gemmatimonadota bacterium]
MRRTVLLLLALAPPLLQAQVTLTAGSLRVAIDGRGTITALHGGVASRNLLASDTTASLLTVVSDGRRVAPTALAVQRRDGATQLTLSYASLGARIVACAPASARAISPSRSPARPPPAVSMPSFGGRIPARSVRPSAR